MENSITNQELMREARNRLSGRWRQSAGVIFIFFLCFVIFDGLHTFIFDGSYFGAGQAGFTNLINDADRIKLKDYGIDKITYLIFLFAVDIPLFIGFVAFFLNFTRKSEVNRRQLLVGYNYFFQSIKVVLLFYVYVLLWSLLLIVPGIIATYRYGLSYFVFIDNPNMSANQIITESKRLMNGNKWKLYCLFFKFFGWFFVGIITLGVGFFWVIPYFQVSLSLFYEDVKKQDLSEQLGESGITS